MILAELGTATLFTEARQDRFPKWNSSCLLRALGAPTLEAALLEPSSTRHDFAAVSDILEYFAARIGQKRLMIRTDRHRETADYMRGGNTFPLAQAKHVATRVLEVGRAVIVLEPTNRFTNKATVNMMVDGHGEWRAEILGPGFDASDLQRGDVIPEYICGGLPFSRKAYRDIAGHAVKHVPITATAMVDRVRSRLHSLSAHIIATDNRVDQGCVDSVTFASKWLIDNGYTLLLRDELCRFPTMAFKRVFEIAQLIYQYRSMSGRATTFVLSSSVLQDNRHVFWDVVDATRKWRL